MRHLRYVFWLVALLATLQARAYDRFFHLTYDEVRVDSVLPRFAFSLPLPADYRDSVYQVEILYPEYLDLTPAEVAAYRRKGGLQPPAQPVVDRRIAFNQKRPELQIYFLPVVFRERRYRYLTSFMLRVTARAAAPATRADGLRRAPMAPADRYAPSSVLASGRWVKVRVPSSGVFRLTDELVRKAGFTDINKVRIYGYGGALQPEVLSADYLLAHDDLHEVTRCVVGGKHLFYAQGPVSWPDKASVRRVRNPYSDYGYYFLTESDAPVASVGADDFLASFYPSPDFYHSLYETDGYSWYHGGRNLFDTEATATGQTRRLVIDNPQRSSRGTLSVNVSAGKNTTVEVVLNDKVLGMIAVEPADEYDHGGEAAGVYQVTDLAERNNLSLRVVSGGPMRLDYVSMAWAEPMAAPDLQADFLAPEYVGKVENQNLHGDGPADMVIILPASGKLMEQAERLRRFHEEHDGLRVRTVTADKLYHEFSSGTPDATAYKRYLKMLYDKAASETDRPRYLLLLGDAFWDNRMLTAEAGDRRPDDYLLCYESENSFNAIKCYVTDDFFTLMDDDEQLVTSDEFYSYGKSDVAVGRMPVVTPEEARVMVDKTIRYVRNENAGAWQNVLMFMGDDGNQNVHMFQANEAADQVGAAHPGYVTRKVMWDAYERTSSAVGHRYADAARAILRQQQAGALVMDYAGHGIEYQLSDEAVLRITDFESFRNENLPLWITASCDIMPFDGNVPTIGETAVLNPQGGAFAFYGTTRTVYESYNRVLNEAYLKHVLSRRDGRPVTIGEAQRLAKIEMIDSRLDLTINKLQYSLLGDPAVALNLPGCRMVIDAINGVDVSGGETPRLRAGMKVRVVGHVEGQPTFNGVVSLTVRDTEESIVCRLNHKEGADTAFVYRDRVNTLFSGTDSIRNGRFDMTFAVPKDMNYSAGTGLINLYGVDMTQGLTAHGASENFLLDGADAPNDSETGPSIVCYLNSSRFTDGDKVNATPLFVAEVKDEDGINTSGAGIGHDMELVIDGDMSKTYKLNEYFKFNFGSYTEGSVAFSIPELKEGHHRLLFRVWDVLNNSSTAELSFHVARGLPPKILSVGVTDNPARTATTFVIGHDRRGSKIEVAVDVFDVAGRPCWSHVEKGVSLGNDYRIGWDLRQRNGAKLQPGIYIYRIKVGDESGKMASKAQKLIIAGNK
ncbi:type IX secretion system sortase PorU [Prevotella sp.]|uniref:type IX secretion system sortase PorU n=1 Tax=Prevotella sp. TaxID=59823 RepID=UPI002F931FF8